MNAALLVTILMAVMVPMLMVFSLSGMGKADEAKARERRLAEHRMNARLLRFNL